MYNYSSTLIRTAKNYNIQERDVIYAYLLAAGVDRADSFHAIYNRGQNNATNDRTTTEAAAADYINNRPGLKVLIQKIKTQARINTNSTQREVQEITEEERRREEEESTKAKELRSKSGITKRIRQELDRVSGKEAVAGLMTLAKLEGFDKEDTRTEEERRKYFLPWRSKCRACAFMRVFRALQEDDGQEEGQQTGKGLG